MKSNVTMKRTDHIPHHCLVPHLTNLAHTLTLGETGKSPSAVTITNPRRFIVKSIRALVVNSDSLLVRFWSCLKDNTQLYG